MPPPPNTVDVNARQRLLAEVSAFEFILLVSLSHAIVLQIHEHCRVLQDFAHHYGKLLHLLLPLYPHRLCSDVASFATKHPTFSTGDARHELAGEYR